MVNIQLLLLAAGTSKRMGVSKQLLPWGNESVIEHQIKTLLDTNRPLSVVLGAYADEITPVIEKFKVDIFINNLWKNGMGSSIAFGVQQVLKRDPTIDGILISLIDQPLLTTNHFNNILNSFESGKKQIIVSRSEKGWTSAPVLFDKMYFKELVALDGEEGAKVLTTKHKDAVLPIYAGDMLIDVDTPDAYNQLLNTHEIGSKNKKC